MVLEESIVTDVALVRAAGRWTDAGNCVFHASARNFNPAAAMSGRLTIVEAEQVVEVGEIDPDDGPPARCLRPARRRADRRSRRARKNIEKRTTRPRDRDRAASEHVRL